MICTLAHHAAFPPASCCGTRPTPARLAGAGASVPFVDPALIATLAPVLWLPETGAQLLHALSRHPSAGNAADLTLSRLRCVKHVIRGPDHCEYLLLRTTERSVAIKLSGQRITQSPVCVSFLLHGLSRAREVAAILAALLELVTKAPRWVKPGSRRNLMRDAFIAIEARSAGASHRDAAEAIFGIRRVREDWSGRGGALKERMRRALAKGQYLCDGGHRQLLQEACRFRL